MNNSILIVEDDVVFCKLLDRFLTGKSFRTQDAQTASGAMKLIDTTSFDFAVIDYRLPDQSGIEVLKHLQSVQPETKVIMMSRFDDVELMEELNALGVQTFIKKPIKPQELLATIEGLR